MRNINAGSVIIVAAVIVVALVILGFLSTLLSNVAIVAFILGRRSHEVNYLQAAGDLLRRGVTQAARAQTTAKAKPAATKTVMATVVQAKPKTVEIAPPAQPERQQQAEENLADFEPKSEEEILGAARLREQEILKNKDAYDPTAALEERRRRLLGQNGEQQSGE
jgi:hypothetical protein